MHLTPAYLYRPTSHNSTNLKMIEPPPPPPPLEELEILWSWCNWQFQWPQHWCHLRFAIYSVSADGGSAGQIFRSLGAFDMCSVTLYDFVTSCFISFGHPLMRWLQTDYFDYHINFIVVITTCCNMILWFITITAVHYSLYYSLYSCIHKYLHVYIVCIGLIKTATLFQPQRPSLITDAQSFMVRTLAATYFLPCTLARGLAPRNEDTCGLGILWSARPQLDLLFQSTAALILCTDEEHLGSVRMHLHDSCTTRMVLFHLDWAVGLIS